MPSMTSSDVRFLVLMALLSVTFISMGYIKEHANSRCERESGQLDDFSNLDDLLHFIYPDEHPDFDDMLLRMFMSEDDEDSLEDESRLLSNPRCSGHQVHGIDESKISEDIRPGQSLMHIRSDVYISTDRDGFVHLGNYIDAFDCEWYTRVRMVEERFDQIRIITMDPTQISVKKKQPKYHEDYWLKGEFPEVRKVGREVWMIEVELTPRFGIFVYSAKEMSLNQAYYSDLLN